MSITDTGYEGRTLVHYASMEGKVDVTRYLIEKGIDVNISDHIGLKAIHVAAAGSYVEQVKVLLENGCVYDAPAPSGLRPVDRAKNEEIIQIMTETEELFDAVKHNDISLVETNIIRGGIVNARNKTGLTCLHFASWKGYVDIIDILLRYGARHLTDNNGFTPLHYASRFHHEDIVKTLIRHKFPYNSISNSGKSPLNLASHSNVVNLLSLIEKSFCSVKNGDNAVFVEIQNTKDAEYVLCLFSAIDVCGSDLLATAIRSDFPKLGKLKRLVPTVNSDQLNKYDLLLSIEKYDSAYKLYNALLQKTKDVFGAEFPITLEIQYKIALVLYKQAYYENAMDTATGTHETQKNRLGVSNTDTLRTRELIGLIFHRQEKYTEALEVFEEVYDRQKSNLGPNHSTVLGIQIHTALALLKLDRLDEALEVNNKVIAHCLQVDGRDSRVALVAQHNTGLVLRNQGKVKEAIDVLVDVYERRRRILGPYHSDTLRSYKYLSIFKAEQDTKAELSGTVNDLYSSLSNILGKNHKDTLDAQLDMATRLWEQRNFKNARFHLEDNIRRRKSVLGDEHPTTLQAESLLDLTKKTQSFLLTPNDRLEDDSILEQTDSDGRTLLHHSVGNGTLHVIQLLLREGVDPCVVSKKGNTALHLASIKGRAEIIGCLLNHIKLNEVQKLKRTLNVRTTGTHSTALHVAANRETAFVLLKYGAMHDACNRDGEKPSQTAKDAVVVQLLETVEELFTATKKKALKNALQSFSSPEMQFIVHSTNFQGKTLMEVLIDKDMQSILDGSFLAGNLD